MSIKRVIKKFNNILSQHQKLRVLQLVFLMIIGGLLETVSVSLILPFMEIVTSPEKAMDKSYVQWMCNLLGIESTTTFLVILALFLAFIYLFKNFYLLLEYNYQYRFVYGNMFVMQQQILDNIIRRPYEYFLGIASGDVIRIINTDIPQVFILLTTLLNLFTELVVSAMLIVAVFIMSPMITIIMALVLLTLVIVIDKIIKPIVRKAGHETQSSLSGMNKWLLQSIQGIKELKATNREEYFEDNFNSFGKKYVNSLRKNYILQNVPRFLIEASCMSAVFVIVAILLADGINIATMIPVLSAIAVAAVRLLPSVNRISSALANISYNEPMLDKLIENLKDISGKENDRLSITLDIKSKMADDIKQLPRLNRELIFQDISYRYPTGEEDVLKDADMKIYKGQSVGIVGTTGAGKTTLVDIMLGLLIPQKGEILVDGYNIQEDISGWMRQIGYIPQEIFMLDDTIKANVAFGVKEVSDEKVWRALKEAALDEFIRTLPAGIDTQIGERGIRLSGGQKQRLGIARALYHNPDVLFFDEATSALDDDTESTIMESVNALYGKKTMIIIAHRLTTIENCDVVYRVVDGRIIRERDKRGTGSTID